MTTIVYDEIVQIIRDTVGKILYTEDQDNKLLLYTTVI